MSPQGENQEDRVDVTTRTFLGLTVACARCHDHKYDPIPTKDFYSLQGIFNSTEFIEIPLAPPAPVTAPPRRTEQLRLGDGTYQLPATTLLRNGPAAKARSSANDAVISAMHYASIGTTMFALLGALVAVIWLPGRRPAGAPAATPAEGLAEEQGVELVEA